MKPQRIQADLNHLVQQALKDLLTIRGTLLAISEENASADPAALVLDLELAGQFKNLTDELRQLLWAYIKAFSAGAEQSPYDLLRSYKAELALETLRSARPPAPRDECPYVRQSSSA
ncbi:MAG TPA: hypothetical protein VKW06_04640 [Candidatus Angelobacter sp.]|nr:hypothetical protein [Candidatus Angelobacter sp.]